MANSIFDRLRNWFLAPIMSGELIERLKSAEQLRNYRTGVQRRQLRVRPNQHDDNVTINYTGLVIDRSVSMLFGRGVEFDLPGEGDTPEDEYLSAVWDANKQQILLQRVAILGAEQGTCYIKIIPDGMGGTDGVVYPRLAVVDPPLVTIGTRPDDIEDVIRYTIEYMTTGLDGKDEAHRQEIERDDGQVEEDGTVNGGGIWWIRDYIQSHATGNQWTKISEQRWEYPFPPMIHWQNLPNPVDVYGVPDVTDDVIMLQDMANFVASNISKLIRLYAHPPRYGVNLGAMSKIDMGPDEMPSFNGTDAAIRQLEALGDLASSQQFLLSLRQSLFDITQTVDISSMSDKLGALTNFGLRVLYADALSKLEQKRSLYGDALLEINRRLLILGGFVNSDPGVIVWPEVLPVNEVEKVQSDTFQLGAGLVSKQTLAAEYNRDWTVEAQRMDEEQQAANANSNNIGSLLLKNFTSGQ